MLNADSPLLDIVIAAIDELGGRGRLLDINRMVRKIARGTGRAVPTDDEIVQTINHYCPRRRSYLKQGDFFEYCGVGEFRVTRLDSGEALTASGRIRS